MLKGSLACFIVNNQLNLKIQEVQKTTECPDLLYTLSLSIKSNLNYCKWSAYTEQAISTWTRTFLILEQPACPTC